MFDSLTERLGNTLRGITGKAKLSEENIQETLREVRKALLEADAWPGPSLVIAYSTCIAHGIDMTTGMSHQRDAVKAGYLTLYHYDPRLGMGGADQPCGL